MNRLVKHTGFERCRIKGRSAFSLVELLVVITIIATLVALAIPAINAMQKSFNSTGTEGMISAALATARTLAISNHQYTGVRFQRAGDPNNASRVNQYMTFIIYGGREETNWVCGFVAVEGYQPIKLPENISVIDRIRRRERTPMNCGGAYNEDPLVGTDLGNNVNITDTSTFSILFSPAGKLVIHEVRCRRRNNNNNDDIFNDLPIGMFIEDYNHDGVGIGVETSRREFYIYNRNEFERLATNSQRWNYLNGPKTERYFINAYTGELIGR